MFNVGGGEIIVIALVALIVLGPDKLPEALRKFGQVLGEIRNVSTGFQAEMQSAMREPPPAPSDEMPPEAEAPTVAAVEDETNEQEEPQTGLDPTDNSDSNSDE